MVIVPRSIYSVAEGENRIELKSDATIPGIHPLYKIELQ